MPTVTAFLKTHIPALLIIVALLVGGHAWLQEHDARLMAEQTVKVAEVQVKDLQSQIQAVNQAAAQKVQVVTQVVHDVKTTPQAVAAIPSLSSIPLAARVSVDRPDQVSVDALPLITGLGQARIDKTNLDACTANTISLQAIISAKETEVAALKHPKGFWRRVAGALKTVGIGVGIGIVIGSHL